MYTYICDNDVESFAMCKSRGCTNIELTMNIDSTVDIQETFRMLKKNGLNPYKIRPVMEGSSLSITTLLFYYSATTKFYKICDYANMLAEEYGHTVGVVIKCDFTRSATDIGVIYAALINVLSTAMRSKMGIEFILENTTENMWNTYIVNTFNVLLPRSICKASVAVTSFESAKKLLASLHSDHEVANIWMCSKSTKSKSILHIIECANLVNNLTFFARSDKNEYF